MSRIATSETPYLLTYRTEVAILVKVRILSCRTTIENFEGNEKRNRPKPIPLR